MIDKIDYERDGFGLARIDQHKHEMRSYSNTLRGGDSCLGCAPSIPLKRISFRKEKE